MKPLLSDPQKAAEIRFDDNITHKNAKESICTLADCFNHLNYYMCTGADGETCPLPNCKKTPDVVVAIIPENSKIHLKIPVFVFEVIGKKTVWV